MRAIRSLSKSSRPEIEASLVKGWRAKHTPGLPFIIVANPIT